MHAKNVVWLTFKYRCPKWQECSFLRCAIATFMICHLFWNLLFYKIPYKMMMNSSIITYFSKSDPIKLLDKSKVVMLKLHLFSNPKSTFEVRILIYPFGLLDLFLIWILCPTKLIDHWGCYVSVNVRCPLVLWQ